MIILRMSAVTLAAAALLLLLTFSIQPVFAEESPLTADQEMVLLDIAAALSDAPQVEIKAQLAPPTTYYSVELLAAEEARIDAIIQRAIKAGLIMSVSVEVEKEAWDGEVSCGTFQSNGSGATWNHPEGEPPSGCPHNQGTSHPGTISANGSMRLSMRPTNSSASVLSAIWNVQCTYEGSESGSSACTRELEKFGGFYGAMFSEKYGFSTDDESPDIWNKVWAYTGVTVVIAGVGYLFFRRREK